jgi:hypothetical protein
MILDRPLVGGPPGGARARRNVRGDGVKADAVEATDAPVLTDGDELAGPVLEHRTHGLPQSI